MSRSKIPLSPAPNEVPQRRLAEESEASSERKADDEHTGHRHRSSLSAL
jgi:hypothetical protein